MANKFVVCAACHYTLTMAHGSGGKLKCTNCNELRAQYLGKGKSVSIGDIGITRAPLRTEA